MLLHLGAVADGGVRRAVVKPNLLPVRFGLRCRSGSPGLCSGDLMPTSGRVGQ